MRAHARLFIPISALAIVVWLASAPWKTRAPAAQPNATVPDFTLLDHTGVSQHLYRYSHVKRIVIVGHNLSCRGLRERESELTSLRRETRSDETVLLLINAGPSSRTDLIEDAARAGHGWPILMDTSFVVSKELGLKGAGDYLVIEPGSWSVKDRGRLGDHGLRRALGLKAQGKDSPLEVGTCDFAFPLSREISYVEHVTPILKKRCLNCHSQQGGYPPYFTSYESLRGWSAMIKETVLTERMPPFSADPHYGSYSNDISLSGRGKWMLVEWINAGMPREPGPDPLQNYVPDLKGVEFLKREKPILEVSAPQVKVPPGGIPEYGFVQLLGPMPEDYWITAIETQTNNPRQIHHECIMVTKYPLADYMRRGNAVGDYVRRGNPEDGEVPIYTLTAMERSASADENYVRVQTYTAGMRQPLFMKNGSALYIPKGYYVILESHHMGTGKWDLEQTTVRFYGQASASGRRQMKSLRLKAFDIEIPPGASRHVVESPRYRVPKTIHFQSFSGHMHMRGRALRVREISPEGQERWLLSIPNYYYGWQTGAGLVAEKPVRIPAGSKLQLVCEYDNSAQNPYNPDPTRHVRYGQTLDRTEMCHASLQYSVEP